MALNFIELFGITDEVANLRKYFNYLERDLPNHPVRPTPARQAEELRMWLSQGTLAYLGVKIAQLIDYYRQVSLFADGQLFFMGLETKKPTKKQFDEKFQALRDSFDQLYRERNPGFAENDYAYLETLPATLEGEGEGEDRLTVKDMRSALDAIAEKVQALAFLFRVNELYPFRYRPHDTVLVGHSLADGDYAAAQNLTGDELKTRILQIMAAKLDEATANTFDEVVAELKESNVGAGDGADVRKTAYDLLKTRQDNTPSFFRNTSSINALEKLIQEKELSFGDALGVARENKRLVALFD